MLLTAKSPIYNGPEYSHFPSASKTDLIIKEKTVFQNCCANVDNK